MKLIHPVENPWEDLPGVTIKINLNLPLDVLTDYHRSMGTEIETAKKVIVVEGYEGNLDELYAGTLFRVWSFAEYQEVLGKVGNDPLYKIKLTHSGPPTPEEPSSDPQTTTSTTS